MREPVQLLTVLVTVCHLKRGPGQLLGTEQIHQITQVSYLGTEHIHQITQVSYLGTEHIHQITQVSYLGIEKIHQFNQEEQNIKPSQLFLYGYRQFLQIFVTISDLVTDAN